MRSKKSIIITFGEEEVLESRNGTTEDDVEEWVIIPLNCKRGCSKVNTDLHVNG